MKLFATIILLTALFLLYRIAYPKQSVEKKGNDILPKKRKPTAEVVGKSKFVLPRQSQPLPTASTSQVSEKEEEKAIIFAPESEKNRSAVIPAEQLDDVFSDDDDDDDDTDDEDGTGIEIEIEDDDSSFDIDELSEEAEELQQALGHEAIFADGIDFDDLQTVAEIIKAQPDEVSEQVVETLKAIEHTDMFEVLVSGNESKINWIHSVLERNVQKTLPEEDNAHSPADNDDYINQFLS